MPELYDNDTPLVTTPEKKPANFNHKPRTPEPDAPRHGETVRISVEDPLMNLSVGDRRYTTVDGGTTIPIADAKKLMDAGVPGLRIHPVSCSGIGPGSRVNGQARHIYFGREDCSCEECKESIVP